MKLVLTEQQYNKLKEYYLVESYIGSINESFSLPMLWKKYKHLIMVGISTAAIIASINALNINQNDKLKLLDLVNTEMKQDTNFNQKVEAVKNYMATAAKNQGFNPEDIQLTPEEMINACNETGFDLPLLMAQAHLESCFGLTKRAQKTNSVFSVGCWDNGQNKKTYSTQNSSIRPYIQLLQNNYLQQGKKTLDDILKPNGFVNHQGNRYASDTKYESKLNSIRNRILKNYPILGQ
jgi:flagellum-specific peptidoglycan hydrolase FlgJ